MRNDICIRAAVALALAAAAAAATAHGDEPHGDEPHAAGAAPMGAPRLEAATDSFEMVGRLENGALTLFVNRFETSEPVLQAEVELESGDHKAAAAFHPEQGSYVLSDPALLQALSQPGSHPVVVTVTSGDEADLLEATLQVAAGPEAKKTQKLPLGTALAGVLGLGAVGAGGLALRKKRTQKGDQP
jgi:hypothetical protein